MKPCTFWFSFNPKDGWVYNHLEYNHIKEDTPTIKHSNQSTSWPKAKWQKKHAYLTETIPEKVIQ